MISIPFEIDDWNAGITEAEGIVRIEDDFLVFQVQIVTLGLFKQDPEIVKIELTALNEIRLERRLIKDRIYIQPKKLELLEVMPGKHGIELMLKVKRKHRTKALLLVDAVRRRKRL